MATNIDLNAVNNMSDQEFKQSTLVPGVASNPPGADADFEAAYRKAELEAAQTADHSQITDNAFQEQFKQAETNGVDMFSPFRNAIGYFGDKWQTGQAGLVRGNVGIDVMLGNKQYESVAQDVQLEQLSQSAEKAKIYESHMSAWDPRTFFGNAIESIPFLGEQTKGGVAGGVSGAVVGAGVGAVAGIETGPGEALTIPGGAAIGWNWGYKGGEFVTASKISAGQMYLDLRDRGFQHDTARNISVAGGAVQGLLATLRINSLSAPVKKAIAAQIAKAGAKKVLGGWVQSYLKEVGIQVSVGELNTITNIVATQTAAALDHNGKPLTNDEIQQQVTEAAVKSLQAGVVLAGATHVAGHVIEKAGTAVKDKMQLSSEDKAQKAAMAGEPAPDPKHSVLGRVRSGVGSVQDAFTVLHNTMKEDPNAAQTNNTSDILDYITKPLFTDQGRINHELLSGHVQKTVVENAPEIVSWAKENGILSEESAKKLEEAIAKNQGPDLTLHSPELMARNKHIDAQTREIDMHIAQVEKEISARDYTGMNEVLQARLQEKAAIDEKVSGLEKKLAGQISEGRDTTHTLDKLEEAYQEQEHLTASAKKAQRAVRQINPNRAAVAALNKKLDSLYEQRAVLETERDLIDSGLLTPEEIKNAQAKLTVGQIASLRAKAVKQMLKNYNRGMKEGVRYTRAEIKAVQTDLVSLVRKSGMEPKDQAKFITKIKNIQTQEQLGDALPEIKNKINSLIEAHAKKEAIKELQRTVEQTKLAKAGKYKVGKFDVDTQKVLDIYRKAITDPDYRASVIHRSIEIAQQNAARSDEFNAAKPDGKIAPELVPETSEQKLERAIVGRVGDIKSKTSTEVKSLNAEMKDIIATGRAKKLDAKIQLMDKLNRIASEAEASINGEKPVDTSVKENSVYRIKNWQAKLKEAGLRWGRTLNSWDGLMAMISIHDRESRMVELGSVHEAIRVEQSNINEATGGFIETLMASTKVSHDAVMERIQNGSKVETIGEYKDAEGHTRNLIMSRNEAIQLWNDMHDPELHAGLHDGNKYTLGGVDSTKELLNKYLTDTDKTIAANIVKWYAKYYDRFNAEWEDETGASLHRNENYSGSAIREGSKESDSSQNFFNEAYSRTSLKPGSGIERVANARPIKTKNAFSAAIRHIQDVEHFAAWRNVDKVQRTIFGNAKIRNTIELKYGKQMLNTLDFNYRNMIGHRSRIQSDALAFVDKVRRNGATALVGGKPSLFLRHYLMASRFMLYCSLKEFVAGSLDFYSNPKKAWGVLNQSPLFRDREHNYDRDVYESSIGRNIFAKQTALGKANEAFKHLNGAWIKYGVKVASVAGGWAVYKAEMAKSGNHELAMQKFENAFNSTQGSGTADKLSQWEMDGRLGKITSMFLKPGLQMVEAETNAVRKLLALPSKDTAIAAAKAIAVIHAGEVLSQLVVVAPKVLTGGEKDLKEAEAKLLRSALLGPLNEIPLWGELISSVATFGTNALLDNKEKIWKDVPFALEAIGSVPELLHMGYKALEDGEVTDGELYKLLHKFDRGAALLLPPSLGGGAAIEPYVWFFEHIIAPPEDDGKDKNVTFTR